MVISDTDSDADADDARIVRLIEGDWPANGQLGLKMLMRQLCHELRFEIAALVEPRDADLARRIRNGTAIPRR